MKFISSLAFVLFAQICVAQENPQNGDRESVSVEDSSSASARARKVIEEFTLKGQELDRKIKAETDPAEKKKLKAQLPNLREYAGRVLVELKVDTQAEGTISSLVWVCRFGAEDQKAEARKLMFAKYKTRKELKHYVDSLSMSYLGEVEKLREVVAVAEERSVKATAQYQLARALLQQNKRNPKLTQEQKRNNESEALVSLKEVKSGGELVKGNPRMEKVLDGRIFQLERLTVGKVVPEIVGVDHAGVEFRLSDYRGKVVMLDFWGYW